MTTQSKSVVELAREVSTHKSPSARWESGDPHDPRSVEIFKHIEKLDFEENGDSFCFKSGGDGDNGETLMYLLDCWFENKPTIPAQAIEQYKQELLKGVELPKPAVAAKWQCCGYLVVGAEYMGQQEMVCCGNPELLEPDWYSEDQVQQAIAAARAQEEVNATKETLDEQTPTK